MPLVPMSFERTLAYTGIGVYGLVMMGWIVKFTAEPLISLPEAPPSHNDVTIAINDPDIRAAFLVGWLADWHFKCGQYFPSFLPLDQICEPTYPGHPNMSNLTAAACIDGAMRGATFEMVGQSASCELQHLTPDGIALISITVIFYLIAIGSWVSWFNRWHVDEEQRTIAARGFIILANITMITIQGLIFTSLAHDILETMPKTLRNHEWPINQTACHLDLNSADVTSCMVALNNGLQYNPLSAHCVYTLFIPRNFSDPCGNECPDVNGLAYGETMAMAISLTICEISPFNPEADALINVILPLIAVVFMIGLECLPPSQFAIIKTKLSNQLNHAIGRFFPLASNDLESVNPLLSVNNNPGYGGIGTDE